MAQRLKYIKRGGLSDVAVQLDLDMESFTYRKWGGVQTCKPGDWIVNNSGDVYTVDRTTFERTYAPDGLGIFRKVMPVWAELAEREGTIRTKEGVTKSKRDPTLRRTTKGGPIRTRSISSRSKECMSE